MNICGVASTLKTPLQQLIHNDHAFHHFLPSGTSPISLTSSSPAARCSWPTYRPSTTTHSSGLVLGRSGGKGALGLSGKGRGSSQSSLHCSSMQNPCPRGAQPFLFSPTIPPPARVQSQEAQLTASPHLVHGQQAGSHGQPLPQQQPGVTRSARGQGVTSHREGARGGGG